ncbi:PREDICTED: uncharacterized protein LOC108660687 [Theobroma cacao]|uniref:Uncharacterized protein LOC108660687 n=1 Tax=Theobroma cacao TaxID=3641 RepID=A0AB32VV52_THECC|nr:PREDICTED: uncharacterized protein LOC108660687 [Theobroma cacao]
MKSDALSGFTKCKVLVENQVNLTVKKLKSDNGTEYITKEFEDYLMKFQKDTAQLNIKNMKLFISRDVVFDEDKLWNWESKLVERSDNYISKANQLLEKDFELNSDDVDEIPMRGTRSLSNVYARCHLAISKPSSYAEVAFDEHWKQAMEVEMKMIWNNKTWVLVDKLKDHNVIGVKWIFRTKLNLDGSVNKYKTRLVVKGFA